ncbi:hypothetical protein D3C81_696970 [compost metagenome]
MAWLQEHDIISKDYEFQSDQVSISTSPIPNPLLSNTEDYSRKEDAIMSLSKAFFGVQSSRPIIINSKSSESSELNSINQSYDFGEGSYNVYTSPNVYEIYFRTLLDKGFISITEFSNLDFINEYKQGNRFPLWAPELGNYEVFKNSTEGSGQPLGQSLPIEGFKDSKYLNKVKTNSKSQDYFMSNSISTIEFLKLIERIMRVNENNMSELESKIITYKYGVDYISKLDEDTKKTVMYLLSQGIIDFENKEEFSELFDGLKKEYLIKLIYRIANKDARVDFSKVQLTDNDNYWLERGMYKQTLEFYKGVDIHSSTQVEEIQPQQNVGFDLFGLLSTNAISIRDNLSANKEYKVTRVFYDSSNFLYKGTLVKDLKPDMTSNPVANIKISSVTKIKKGDDGAREDAHKVIFIIRAPSDITAVAMVDSGVSVLDADKSLVSKVDTIAKVENSSKEVTNYLPKSALQGTSSGNSVSDEIVALDDKYLMNTDTGTRAVLLDDNKKALIGNEVISTNDNIVSGIGGEVYYNMDIVSRLMSNTYLDSMWDNKFYIGKTSTSDIAKYQGLQSIMSYDSKSVIDRTYVAWIEDVRKNQTDNPEDKNSEKTTRKFYSMLHTSNISSTVYRNIVKDLGMTNPIYLVVNWNVVIPDANNLSNKTISNLRDLYYGTTNPSASDMSNFFNQRPTDTDLRKWWDSNTGLSNALLNYIYGTKNLNYSVSGYLCPEVTILSTGNYTPSELDGIVENLNFSQEYRSKFIQGNSARESIFSVSGDDWYAKLSKGRTFTYIKGRKMGDSGAVEYGNYVIDKTGVLYKSFGSNDSYISEGIDQNLESETSNGVTRIKVVARQSNSVSSIQVRQEYVINGQTYVCTGETGSIGNGNNYMVLVKKDSLKGIVDSTNTYYEGTTIDSSKTLDKYLYAIRGDNNQENSNYFYFPSTNEKNYNIGKPPSGDGSWPKEEALYYVPDGSGNTSKTKVVKVDDKGSASDYKASSTETVLSNPILLLNRFNWNIKSGNELNKQLGTPLLFRENMYGTGVANSIIDSIVGKSYGYKGLSELKDGSTVIIGDMSFTVQSNRLVSEPIKNQTAINNLKPTAKADDLKSVVAQLLDGISIKVYKTGNYNQGVDDTIALSDYIQKDSKGQPNVGFSGTNTDISKEEATLVSAGSKLGLSRKGTVTTYNNEGFSSFIFSVVLEDSIKFRPIDRDGITYTLVQTSTQESNGHLTEVPFFTTSLGYDWYDDIFNKTSINNYKTAIDPDGVMSKLKEIYAMRVTDDILTVLKKLLLYLLSYLTVMNMVIYLSLKVRIIKLFFEKLKDPNKNGAKGIDVSSILTLGFQKLESPFTILNFVGIEGLFTILLSALLTFF